MDITEYLSDWFENYIKNRDLITKSIQEIEKPGKDYAFIINYKNNTKGYVIVDPVIRDFNRINSLMKDDSPVFIVLYNIQENVDSIINNWESLKDHKMLKLYFVNPFQLHDNKWIISPHIHDRISDESSLKRGLVSLFEGVEPLAFEEIEKKISKNR